MKGATRGLLAGITALGLAATAGAADPKDVTDADRVYRNYTREAATVQPSQIRMEVRGMRLHDEDDTRLDLLGFPVPDEVNRVHGGVFEVLGSYGLGSSSEVGFVIPVFIEKRRIRGAQKVDSSGNPVVDANGNPVFTFQGRQEEDVGDVSMYGKFKRQVAENCAVAGGVELSVPTGIERKGFGTGEVGVNPFISSRYQKGRFGFGGHVGYQIYTGDVVDIFNYGVEAIMRATESYALRVELAGRLFKTGGTEFHDAVVLPGFEYNYSPNFTIRPTGLANVTDEALDWGVGLGLAYAF